MSRITTLRVNDVLQWNGTNWTNTTVLVGTIFTTAVAGGVAYSGSSSLKLTVAGTAGQLFVSGGAGAPTWANNTSPQQIFSRQTTANVTGSTGIQTVYTDVVNANAMGANGFIEIDFTGSIAALAGTAGNILIRTTFGPADTTLGLFTLDFNTVNGTYFRGHCIIANRNNTAINLGRVIADGSANTIGRTQMDTGTAWPRTGTVDTTAACDLKLKVTLSNNSDSVNIDSYIVKVYNSA